MLRRGSTRWAPKNETKKEARVSRGKYKCNCCKKVVGASKIEKGKRVTNVFVDHIQPVVSVEEGFTTWDSFIENLFCEKDNLQLICKACHSRKTMEERRLAKERK